MPPQPIYATGAANRIAKSDGRLICIAGGMGEVTVTGPCSLAKHLVQLVFPLRIDTKQGQHFFANKVG